jgi:hypothetical protein
MTTAPELLTAQERGVNVLSRCGRREEGRSAARPSSERDTCVPPPMKTGAPRELSAAEAI